MKYYKVYAQCVRVSRPIKEIYEQDVYTAINDEVVTDAIENYGVGNSLDEQIMDKEISDFYDKAVAYFEKTGIINCGDFCIIKADDMAEVSRPNMCGYDTGFIL